MSAPAASPDLRRATVADAEAVRALTRRAYAPWVPVLGREPLPMLADHERAVRDDWVDLLVADGRLAGLVHMVLRTDDLLVENLAVAPEAQGRGHGGLLLRHAEATARSAGRPILRLYTNALMAANLRFYAARGYATEWIETSPLGRRVHLAKPLAPAGVGA